MRKTIYKKFDKDSQDIILELTSKQIIIQIFCYMFWAMIFIFPFIPLIIIDIFEDIQLGIITQILIIVFILMWGIGLLVSMKIFRTAMFGFSELLAERIYFLTYTTKGNALSKKDFEVIKQNKDMFISTQMCRGYCYSVCFEICKVLKKGSIEFLAVKQFSPHEEDDGKNFTMHVIYVNNGWAFDTYSSRQYQIEKLHEIYKAKVYKSFSFDEISRKSYEEFKEEQEPKLAEWAINNDCSMFCKNEESDF
mgnify:CR=1 FL=1